MNEIDGARYVASPSMEPGLISGFWGSSLNPICLFTRICLRNWTLCVRLLCSNGRTSFLQFICQIVQLVFNKKKIKITKW